MTRPLHPSRFVRRLPAFLALVTLLATVGCGGPALSTVSGSVLSGKTGKKVPLGTVILIASNGLPFSAPIGEDGSYSIPNVPVGKAKLGVSSPNPSAPVATERPGGTKKPSGPDDGGGTPAPTGPVYSDAAKKAWFPVAEKLTDPLSSNLTVDVVAGATLHDIKVD